MLDFSDNIELSKITRKQEEKWLKLLIKCIEPKGLNPDSYIIYFICFK